MNKEIKDKNLTDHINGHKDTSEMSSNFTFQVMTKVENLEIKKSITDKPLISPVGWVIFALFGGLLITSFVMATQSTEIDFSIPEIDFSSIQEYFFISVFTIFAICALVFIDILMRRSKRKNGPVA